MIDIDGSYGEGGGAILRQALGMAAWAGEAVRIRDIRAQRPKPGLAAQHLRAVEAAGALCGARVRGAGIGSTEVVFEPGQVKPGTFEVDIGTAGSAMLVLQTVLLPALTSPGRFDFRLIGGTDVPWSPPADYFAQVTLPALRRFGSGSVTVRRRGYYPKGGGEVEARLEGRSGGLDQPLDLRSPVIARSIRGVSHAAERLRERRVAERQAEAANHLLARLGCPVEIAVEYSASASLGSGLTLWTESQGGALLGGSALGARQMPAEEVGREAARQLMNEMEAGAAVDRHLADQLVPFLALAGGRIYTSGVSEHVRSNIYVAEKILGASFDIDGLTVIARPSAV